MRVTLAYLNELVQAEVDAGIPSERIVLGGFSQGAAMAMFAGLTGPKKLGGVVGLSGWLVLSGKFAKELEQEGKGLNRETPIWLGHGGSDPLVRTELGVMSKDALKGLGFNVEMKIYP